jgi:drug/metabolite transporter superfamily protein YnfA
MLPLEDNPVKVVKEAIICEAMFLQHKLFAGRIALVAVILNLISITVGLILTILKKDAAVGSMAAAFGGLTISVFALIVSLWRESMKDIENDE